MFGIGIEWSWVVGFFTAALSPIISDLIKKKLSRPKISAAILGACSVQTPLGWCVRISLRNDGNEGDTLVSAHLSFDDDSRNDCSNFSMQKNEKTGSLKPWNFADPMRVAANSCVAHDFYFWITWQNEPTLIELCFLSGKSIQMILNNENMQQMFFKSTASKVAIDAIGTSKLQPFWFKYQ